MNALHPTYHELEETMRSMTEKMNKMMVESNHQMDTLSRENQMLRSRLAHYENSNTPSLSRSLEYRKKSRIHKAKENIEMLPSKKPSRSPYTMEYQINTILPVP